MKSSSPGSHLPDGALRVLPRLGVLFLGAVAALLALGELPHDERGPLVGALRSAA